MAAAEAHCPASLPAPRPCRLKYPWPRPPPPALWGRRARARKGVDAVQTEGAHSAPPHAPPRPRPLGQARKGQTAADESLGAEKFIAPLALPKLPPQRLYFVFQKPIVTDPAWTKVWGGGGGGWVGGWVGKLAEGLYVGNMGAPADAWAAASGKHGFPACMGSCEA